MQPYSVPNPSSNTAMDVIKDVTLKVCLDVLLLIISGIPILVFKFGVEPFHRGFFCDDESIAHPVKDDTIPTSVLATVGLGLNILVMLIGEFVIYRRSLNAGDLESQRTRENTKSYTFFRRAVHPYLVSLYITIGAFLVGCAICQSSTDLIKYSIGRLRPNFLAQCKPDWSKITCQDEQGLMIYIEDYECTGDPKHIRESRLSHPSGHASLSFFCMLYLSFYLQSKLVWRGSKLLRHFLQFAAAYMALYTCASRVSDYKHHWSDVLGGAVLGAVVAVLTTVYISDLCKRRRLYRVVEKLSEIQHSLQGSYPPGSYPPGSYPMATTPGTATTTVPNTDLPMEGRLSLQI